MVTCIAVDYSSLPTCYHGNIAMQMAVDYIGLTAYSHAQVHIHMYVHIRKHVQTTVSPTSHIRSEIYTMHRIRNI